MYVSTVNNNLMEVCVSWMMIISRLQTLDFMLCNVSLQRGFVVGSVIAVWTRKGAFIGVHQHVPERLRWEEEHFATEGTSSVV